MQANFPTISIFKQAVQLPLKHVGAIFASIGMFFGATLVAIVFLGITMVMAGFDPAALENFAQNLQSGDFTGLGSLIAGYFVALVVVLFIAAHIFNYWVNLAVYGKEQARWSFSDGRLSAALVNGLKLLLIGILIGLISVAVTFALSSIGLAPSFSEQMVITDVTESITSTFTSSIIMAVVSCIVYSIFSANLTQTALSSDAEGLEHPHNVDFAIVLVLLYALYLIPTVIAALTGSIVFTYIVSMVFVLHLMFTVPVAHGLRYRICVKEKSEDIFE